ncbi:MAG: chorismate-binding protein [Actinomycetota bacterium]|nr:chorismate-binding protein [Actinomycetota bacterium]MDA8340992.1 chorismate-binding protein [Actinomycetota bacterium]
MTGGGCPELDRDGFHQLAARHRIVPVWRELVADTITPVAAFLTLVGAGDRSGFLLESVEGGERWGRYSFVGRNPLAVVTASGGRVTTEGSLDLGPLVERASGPGILAALESILAEMTAPVLAGLPPLHSGLVGYLGYDVVREVEHLGPPPPDDQGHPDAVVTVIGQLAAFDHWRQRVVLVDNVAVDPSWNSDDLDRAFAAAAARLDDLERDCFRPPGPLAVRSPPHHGLPEDVSHTMTAGAYRGAVAAAKEHITAGDIFQVVLSRRFDVERLGVDPFEVYRVLRLVNPSPYLYFLRLPAVTVVGASPEPMVRVRDGVVVSRPIAGSRPRGAGDELDRLMEAELVEDPKERAEHVMLVDLARNDVGRVAAFGTERVDELMVVERYSHIMHLTSQVSGRLAPGKGPVDVLRATLPAGTLSGAPKVRAMEIIDDLEVTKRGIYGGIVGYIDFSGNLDTAIAIRTMTTTPDGRASVQAGAGIVADSDPVREYEECAHKAAALLDAVARARQMAELAGRAVGGTDTVTEEARGTGTAGWTAEVANRD